MKEKIRVLIVDSSVVFRQTLAGILKSDPLIEVIATAADPYIAANKMAIRAPDVITLDIEMSRMNGLTFLKKIMHQHPIPVIIISALVQNNPELRLKAIEYGAVEVMSKKVIESVGISMEDKKKICETIKSALGSVAIKKPAATPVVISPKFTADVILQHIKPQNLIHSTDKVIAVGASTGGINAIGIFLEALPADVPGVVIVQHLPKNFTKSFADRLDQLCEISVKEAEDGDIVKPGQALIAPGNRHILLRKKGTRYYVQLNDGDPVNRHRPSVDVLFRSAALYAGKNSIGILLTGMGDDGARGLLEMKTAGAKTIAQDENSCVVFGMPKEAILLNAADAVLPLKDIAAHVLRNL